MQILPALYVHKDRPPREPDRHHDQFSPERPRDKTAIDFLNGPFDKYEQRPHDAEGRHTVEKNRAAQTSPLNTGHLQQTPLIERFDFSVHDEVKFA